MIIPAQNAKHTITVRLFEPPQRRARKGDKIIILKLGERIGDFVTAVDAFRIIRNAFADAEITLICMPSIVALAESTGLFNRIIGFALVQDVMGEGKVPRMDQDDQIAAFTTLLDGEYTIAADFRHDGSTRHWLDHINATYRAGFSGLTRKGLDIVLPQMEWDVASISLGDKSLPPTAEMRVSLLAHAIVETLKEKTAPATVFPIPPALRDNPVYVGLCDDQRLKIGVSLGAGSELRQWGIDYWGTLLRHIAQTHDPVFVFFGGKAEQPLTETLIAQLAPARCVNMTATLPLAHVPTVFQALNAYIGCDTGLTHLAGKLGIPTVNIYAGISNISTWGVHGAKVKTVYAETICAPCHLRFVHECPNNNICMKAISPEIVYDCFEQVIAL